MKKYLISLLALFIVACGSKNDPTPTLPPAEKPAPERQNFQASPFREVFLQTFDLQGISVSVTLGIIGGISETHWVVIETPSQTLHYKVLKGEGKVEEGLSDFEIETLHQAHKSESHVDLDLEGQFKRYAYHNVLEVDRCRYSEVRQQLVDLFKTHRSAIYFSVTMRGGSDRALKWDLDRKKFIGLVPVYDQMILDGGKVSDQDLILVPNANPVLSRNKIAEDSAFLRAENFVHFCDATYDPKDLGFLRNGNYLPHFNPESELRTAKYISRVAFPGAFVSPKSIYQDFYAGELNEEIKTYAEQSPLLKQFLQGPKNDDQ